MSLVDQSTIKNCVSCVIGFHHDQAVCLHWHQIALIIPVIDFRRRYSFQLLFYSYTLSLLVPQKTTDQKQITPSWAKRKENIKKLLNSIAASLGERKQPIVPPVTCSFCSKIDLASILTFLNLFLNWTWNNGLYNRTEKGWTTVEPQCSIQMLQFLRSTP